MKKPDPSKTGRIVKVTWPRAKQDYECYGCAGECPVPKGEWYMNVALLWKGKIQHIRYCQRCACALENRVKNTSKPGVTIDGKGALRFNRLSSAFRHAWQDFIASLKACNTPEEHDQIEDIFMKQIRGEA